VSAEADDVVITAYAATDVGKARDHNEDSYLLGDGVFAVADGMGGHRAGEVASDTALDPLRELDAATSGEAEAEQRLADAVREANRRVVELAAAEPAYDGMGTTLTAVLAQGPRLHLAHVGDSRAYLLRDGSLSQLSVDHTLVEELVREGRLSRDEAAEHPQRSVITRAVGIDEEVAVDTLPSVVLGEEDQLLLCSDGLTGPVDEATIAELLTAHDDGDEACAALLTTANSNGGPDNITALLLRAVPRSREGQNEHEPAAVGAAAGSGAADSGEQAAGTEPAAVGGGSEAETEGSRSDRRLSRRLTLAVLLGLAVLALLAAGGYALLSQAYFVGDDDGTVAIYRGLPVNVAGVSLSWVAEPTELPTERLPAFRQRRLRDGLTVATFAAAQRTVAMLRRQASAEPPTPDAEAGSGPGGANGASA
jgi:protein phosphatase